MEDFKDTNNLTPIEALLEVDTDGTVSAKNVYEFLELDPSNYSRWCKKNIAENEFAEENVDFRAFVINDEWGGQATTDYKLSINFAKKLCMQQKNERGEQARNYFIKVEGALKKLAQTKLQQIYSVKSSSIGELANMIKVVTEIMKYQGSANVELAEQTQLMLNQHGIKTIKGFVKHIPRQLTIDDYGLI